jgi:uncharacterized protein (TIGR03067 family)
MCRAALILSLAIGCTFPGPVLWSQQTGADAEYRRLQGRWQIVELVDNGRVIAASRIQEWLPSGGRLEVVDNTLLFTSPLDGQKTAKSFTLDPAVYPNQITVAARETIQGAGIYRFDGERLVVCLANPQFAARPQDFSARVGSHRMLMTLERSDQPPRNGSASRPGLALPPPPERVPQPGVAGRVLTDAEVCSSLLGTWRLNDGQGLLDVTFFSNGAFQGQREANQVSTFHSVFAPAPISSGQWTVRQGQLMLQITASSRLERVNQQMQFAVRSVSGSDLIFVDYLGRVGKAVKVR